MLKGESNPKFCKPRPVPFGLQEGVEQELKRLCDAGTIESVTHAEWASPVVPILKNDGSIRLCGDYKKTVNPSVDIDTYPVPTLEQLYAKLAGGQTFSKLDLRHAYQQIPLDLESRKYTTINTLRGLFQYTTLPFGISSAPAIFQRTMEMVLSGTQSTAVYFDDILITGESQEQHEANLREVLSRLAKANLTLKKEKCQLFQKETVFLGHSIDSTGLHPMQEKVKAIQEAPAPRNVAELRSFLGLLNHYGRYLPNLSSVLAPLHKLLVKYSKWQWGKDQQISFVKAKSLLQFDTVLVHYDPRKPIVVTCDASPYGVGAVLQHTMSDGNLRPVAFASRSLSSPERNYSQLDREGLAMIFGVKHFHQYLLGQHFTIHTDHKPLLGLFGQNKHVPQLASPRIQRWAIILSAYHYNLEYIPGRSICQADAMSRLPLPSKADEVPPTPQETVLLMQHFDASQLSYKDIQRETQQDPTLANVFEYTIAGWPREVNNTLQPYYNVKEELSTHEGCLLRGARVIIPPKHREIMLEMVHDAHPGIVRMKLHARNYCWWPGIDKDLEKKVQECLTCQTRRNNPPKAPIVSWPPPTKAWSRLHIDYAGPIEGKMILVVIDVYSKWIDAFITASASSAATISHLRSCFATHGIPDIVVSDNGTSFTSSEFKEFLSRNGVLHKTSPPYHPASNGPAERAVQVIKQGLRKSTGDLQTRLSRILFAYRITPPDYNG